MTTVARMNRAALDPQQNHRKESAFHITHKKGHSLGATDAKNVVLYAFHRDELPYLNIGGAYLFDMDEEAIREAIPVVVKGLGVRGIGRVVKVWGHKCWDGFRLIGKRSSSKGRSSIP